MIKLQRGFVGEDKPGQDGEEDNDYIVDATGRRQAQPQPEGMLQIKC